MLIVLLILFEIRTSIIVCIHTDMYADTNTDINVTNKHISPMQIELPTLIPILKLL